MSLAVVWHRATNHTLIAELYFGKSCRRKSAFSIWTIWLVFWISAFFCHSGVLWVSNFMMIGKENYYQDQICSLSFFRQAWHMWAHSGNAGVGSLKHFVLQRWLLAAPQDAFILPVLHIRQFESLKDGLNCPWERVICCLPPQVLVPSKIHFILAHLLLEYPVPLGLKVWRKCWTHVSYQ